MFKVCYKQRKCEFTNLLVGKNYWAYERIEKTSNESINKIFTKRKQFELNKKKMKKLENSYGSM